MAQVNFFVNRIMNPLPKVTVAPKNRIYLKLQYLGPLSFHLRKSLRKLLTPCYPQLEFRFIFTNKNNIRKLLPYKDQIPDLLQSNVIYEYQCVRCNSNVTYIGKTTCNLAKRIAEHQGLSERTGKARSSPPTSSVRDHCLKKHNEPPDSSGFKIIGKSNTQDLSTLEATYITLKKPSLNTQLDHEILLTL